MLQRAWSQFTVKGMDDKRRRFSGIASTPSTDRMGDVVEPKGATFKLPIPFLWQHDSKDPIGWITAAKVTDKGIEVEGEVANVDEAGPLRDRLLTAWQMLKAGIVRGLSIGFNASESEPIKGTYGLRFKKWEWLELSAVTIAANQDASILAIK
jgi:HK97 family phage prohead protease